MIETITISNDALQQISALAKYQQECEYNVEQAEQNLQDAKKELQRVQEELLPLAMAEAGMKSFVLDNGAKISIKDDLAVSVPKDRKAAAYQWLRDNGLGDCIKHVVAVEFGKEDDEAALRLMEYCERQGKHAEDTESVHAQTLKAVIKEVMAKGIDVPLDLFGAYPYSKAIIK
jgi:predicted ribosome quality control (RQC) complex YloA/Tae2 family protein